MAAIKLDSEEAQRAHAKCRRGCRKMGSLDEFGAKPSGDKAITITQRSAAEFSRMSRES